MLHSGSSTHTRNRLAFAPPRGVAEHGDFNIGHVKGWLHWRLLGALIKGDARAAYSRRVVAPSSSLRPVLFSTRVAPAPLCCAWAIESHPITSQSLTHQPCPSAPVHHVLSSTSQRSRRAPKRKWVWRLETCDGALLSWHRPTRLPVREGRLQTLEATLRPTLVLPLQPLTVLPVAGAATLCCR